jgi:hypothetical protein
MTSAFRAAFMAALRETFQQGPKFVRKRTREGNSPEVAL